MTERPPMSSKQGSDPSLVIPMRRSVRPFRRRIEVSVRTRAGFVRTTFARLSGNALARISTVVLASLFLIATFADVLASDLPILCRVHGQLYVFPNLTHPRALADEDCTTLEAKRSPGDWAIEPLVAFGTENAPAAPVTALASPTIVGAHPLGTDAHGRDVFARVIHGTRTSLAVAIVATLAFVTIGIIFGGLAGFFGGAIDALVARAIEALTSFPSLVLLIVVQAVVAHPTTTTILVAFSFSRWPEVARLVRAEILLVSEQDYVLAARALGASPWRVLARHIAPNARAPVLVAATFGLGSVVLLEASLDFLRLGVSPNVASWGETLSEAREHAHAWWLLLFPGLALLATVIATNLVGEALRDALDPRLRVGNVGGDGSEGARTATTGAKTADSGPPTSRAYGDGSRT